MPNAAHRRRPESPSMAVVAPAASSGSRSWKRPWIVGALLVAFFGIAGYSIGALTDEGSVAAPGAATQLSYRPSARRGNDPYNPMSHIGFRLVMTAEQWLAHEATKQARQSRDHTNNQHQSS